MKRPKLRDTEDHISEEAAENGSRLVPAGTIFIVIRGMILARDLPVAMAEVPMAFNQDMKAVLPGDHVDGVYLLYALASRKRALTREISSSAHGTRRMGTASLESLFVAVPPLPEQRAIAAVLSKIQAAVEVQDKIVATLKELKAATMAKLFREGLRGEPLKPTEIGEIPQSWEVVRLRSILAEPLRNGHSAVASMDRSGIRTLTLTAVTQRDFSLANTKVTTAYPTRVQDLWLRDGDIFVERANTAEMVGLAALYRGRSDFAIFPDLLIRVRVDPEVVASDVLVEWLLSSWCRSYFQKHCRGAATSMPKIDHRTVEELPVLVPRRTEQQLFAQTIRKLDIQLSTARQRADFLKALFSSVLHLLMTGEVRVNRSYQ